MKRKYSKAYLALVDLYEDIAIKSLSKKAKKETIGTRVYANENIEDVVENFVPNEFTQVRCNIFVGLSARASKIVMAIIGGLKDNNALWHFDHRKNQADKKAVAELRKKQILIGSETPDIHVVNPWFIWRGTPAGVAFKTMELLKNVGKVNTDHIISLRSKTPPTAIIPKELVMADNESEDTSEAYEQPVFTTPN